MGRWGLAACSGGGDARRWRVPAPARRVPAPARRAVVAAVCSSFQEKQVQISFLSHSISISP